MNLSISWRAIAITSTCTAIALAVVLAVVSAEGSADYLSTLALALAVIAFVVQIIVFIAQTAAVNQQLNRAEELHGLTTRALAAIEEKAEGTRRTVNVINDRMLEAVLGKALPEATSSGSTIDSSAVARRVSELLRSTSAAGAAALSVPSLAKSPQSGTSADGSNGGGDVIGQQRHNKPLLPLPRREEAGELANQLDTLSNDGLHEIRRLGRDYEKYGPTSPNSISHGIAFVTDGRSIYELGLARKIRVQWEERPVWILTAKGKQAAALLVRTQLPEDYPDAVRKIRARVLSYDAEREAHSGYNDGVPVGELGADEPST